MDVKFLLHSSVVLCLLACSKPRHEDVVKYKKHKHGYVAKLELEDSSLLVHVNNQFYKSEDGQLFEKTMGYRESVKTNSLVEVVYFNGMLPQEIDPTTFEQLDGWFAKDKNAVYYYRPTSGGMLYVKMNNADRISFKLLQGHYKYAVDKDNFYSENNVITGFNPDKTILFLNNKTQVVKMICGKNKYEFEL